MKGNVSVHVHGAGVYSGDNRVVTFTDVYYMPDLPSYRRVLSAGYLESGEHNSGCTTLEGVESFCDINLGPARIPPLLGTGERECRSAATRSCVDV